MNVRTIARRPPTVERRDTLGTRIERERLSRGWTQADLAERASLSQQTVYRAEVGHEVYAWVLAAIAEALETTMDDLWRGES